MALNQQEVNALQNSSPTDWSAHDFELDNRSSGDANRFAADSKLHVRFYRAPVLDQEASVAANRAVYKDAEMVEIMMPGEKNSIIRDVVWKQHVDRFPEKYAKFKAGLSQHVGTPVSLLPFVTESNAKELEFFNIFTVEQLAGMADTAKQRFMGAGEMSRKAQEWLDQMNSSVQIRKELAERDARESEVISDLKKQLADLTDLVAKNAGQKSK